MTLEVVLELKAGDVVKFKQTGASMGCSLGNMKVNIQKMNIGE